jgi:hypothetical protein
MKMIVVGNGIITEPQGHLINMMDTVVRLSGYKIIGYESLVGTKTDIVSVSRIENLNPLPAKVWVGNPYGLGDTPVELVKKAYPNGYINNETTAECYKQCGYNESQSHPTLGMHTIFMAMILGKYFYDKIYLTGFDFGQVGLPLYYWTKELREKICPSDQHNCPNERKVLKRLLASGAVELLNPRDVMILEEGYQ